jgi:hypothetical protein
VYDTAGTSNAVTFTANLPTKANIQASGTGGWSIDNSSNLATPAIWTIETPGATTITFYKSANSTNWTSPNGKREDFVVWYEAYYG